MQPVNPSCLLRRQEHINFEARLAMEFFPEKANESAGLVLTQNPDFHFRLEYMLREGSPRLVLTRRHKGVDSILASVAVNARLLLLKVEAKGQAYSFFYAVGNNEWNVVQTDVDGRTLSRTNAGGFTGTMIGPYASSNGSRSSRFVDVDWFEYREAASK
jgi:alpha-N-arabinofuranosidase